MSCCVNPTSIKLTKLCSTLFNLKYWNVSFVIVISAINHFLGFPTEKRRLRKHILILTNSTTHLVIYVSLNVANK